MKPFTNIFAALSIMVSLASPLAMAAEPIDTSEIRAAVQTAATQGDHELLAKYYEDAAVQMQAKITEKKELLEHYEDKSYIYGRQAQDLQSHAHALIRDYQKTVRATLQAAARHRQIASMLNQNHAAVAPPAPGSVSGL